MLHVQANSSIISEGRKWLWSDRFLCIAKSNRKSRWLLSYWHLSNGSRQLVYDSIELLKTLKSVSLTESYSLSPITDMCLFLVLECLSTLQMLQTVSFLTVQVPSYHRDILMQHYFLKCYLHLSSV